MEKRILSQVEVSKAAFAMATSFQQELIPSWKNKICRLYGVPRGGIPVAYLLASRMSHYPIVVDGSWEKADLIVDDLIDSGLTKLDYSSKRPGIPFFALADFLEVPKAAGQWLVFPWEVGKEDTSADDIVTRLLQFIGEDPKRGGLIDTPNRVLKAWKHWTSGYGMDPAKEMKVFQDGGEKYNEMVVRREIPFHSHCEHHLAPFFGTATVAYIPDGKVPGLSKIDRVVDIFARRLQVQERLTCQIADAIQDALQPKGVGVVVKARHFCIESRGVQKHNSETITSALRGEFLNDQKVRSEFLALAR